MIRPILDDEITILRMVPGDSDRYGNTPLEPSPVAREVPCRVIPVQGTQDNVDRQETGQGRLQVILPAGIDVAHTDEVIFEGERYRIADVPKRFGRRGLDHHIELLLERYTR